MVLFRHSEPRKFSDLLIGHGNFPPIPCSVLGIYKEGVPLFQATQFPVHFYPLLLELPRGFNVGVIAPSCLIIAFFPHHHGVQSIAKTLEVHVHTRLVVSVIAASIARRCHL